MKYMKSQVVGGIALLMLGAAASCALADASYSTVILSDAPIGYWRLGESGTDTIAVDSSGNLPTTHNGIYSRGVVSGQPGAIKGDPTTSAQFDYATAWIDVLVTASPDWPFNLVNNFTAEAWVINAGQQSPGSGRIVSNGDPGNIGWGFGILPDGRTRFTTFGVKDYDSGQTIIPQDSAWHYVAVVFDAGNTANFYLDGVLTDIINGPGPVKSAAKQDLMIGRNPVNPSQNFFNGNMQEVAIYNYALTEDQVAAHYNAGL
jgi:Concanavalin A-like lectin/glucanases superfamily